MREEIYSALFALLAPITGPALPLKTTSRRLQFVEECDIGLMPGVWQNQYQEVPAAYGTLGVACWYFDVDWYLYCGNNDETVPTTPIINPALDAVMSVLPKEDSTGAVNGILRVTVPGYTSPLVCTVSLREPVRTWEGLLNNKSVTEIPLRILVPTGG